MSLSVQKKLIATYRTPILGADGQPLLQTPAGWQGPIMERLAIPTTGECGPQFSGMPAIFTSKRAPGRRWYRCNGRTLEIPTPPLGMDILGATYEREYEHWECEPGCETLCMRLHPATIERYLQEDAYRFDLQTRYAHLDEALTNHLFALADELQEGLPNGTLFAEGLSMMIVGWLRRHYVCTPPPETTTKGGFSSAQQNTVREFIDTYLGADLRLETMATELGMSPFHFLRLFRHTFGMPPHRYVLQMRLARAAALLRNERERTIADIALTTGFASQAHFTSTFKRHTGQTPATWRNGSH